MDGIRKNCFRFRLLAITDCDVTVVTKDLWRFLDVFLDSGSGMGWYSTEHVWSQVS